MYPRLPSEIFALIVKEGAPAMLTTTSLGSREFRVYSHEELFRSVELGPSRVPAEMSRIWRFLELINADAESQQNGLASYIQPLHIFIRGTFVQDRKTLDDGTLAGILRKLFKKRFSYWPVKQMSHWSRMNNATLIG